MGIPYGFENTFFCIDNGDRAVVLKQGVEEHNKPLKGPFDDLIVFDIINHNYIPFNILK